MNLTMIGHSTMLVEVEGLRVIVDPFFAPRSLSISRRTVMPSLTAEQAAQRCDLVVPAPGDLLSV